ncbi:MAG: O-antigen ligase family protein [Candidatus Obscuribacterales bacterium]|nr:O-antigen ligase family protein [Candidatus Obscuribacterales bacterium]
MQVLDAPDSAINAAISKLALEPADSWWSQSANNSIAGRLLKHTKDLFSAASGLSPFGTILQRIAYLLVIGLFVAIALPQFAEDKEGLGLIALCGFAFWFIGYLLGGTEERQSLAVDIPVWLFLAANLISAASSHYPVPSLRGLAKLLIYITSYFLFTAVLRKAPQRRVQILSLLVVIAFGVSLYGLYQYKIGVAPLATWEDPTVEVKGTRIFSTLLNPNLLAGYLIPIAPVAISLGALFWQQNKKLLSLGAFIAAATIAISIVLTGSRAGYLALFACGGAVAVIAFAKIWVQKPKARIPILIAAVVVPLLLGLALHFVPTFDQRVSSIFAGREHSSNAFRINVWQSSLRMLKDNWWLGIGVGNQAFRLAYGLYMRSGFDALGTYCVPLEIAVETGIGGLIIFGALLASVFAKGHLAFWQNEDITSRWLAAGACAGIIGMMAQGLWDTVFYRPQVHFIFWLLIAVVVSCRPQPDLRER